MPLSFYMAEHSFEEAFVDSTLGGGLLASLLLLESREFLDRLMVAGVPMDSVRNFTAEFLATRPFRQIDFADFNEAFRRRFGVDMEPVLSAQYKRKGVPSYIVESLGMEVNPHDERVRFSRFRIYNNSDVDGFVHVEKSIRIDSDAPFAFGLKWRDFQYEAYEIKAHTGIEFRTRRHLGCVLHTNLSRNVPSDFGDNFCGYSDDTNQYVRPVEKEVFLPAENEIIVDNEDEGFGVSQSKLGLLERWREGSKMPWEKYTKVMSNIATSRWQTLIGGRYYGYPIQSMVAKIAGNGSASVEWRAQLPQEGEYEIWVYIPDRAKLGEEGRQEFIVEQEEWREVVELENWSTGDWTSLGKYDCQKRECVVSLSDKGESGQVIYGDAVKWVYVGGKDCGRRAECQLFAER